MSQEKIAILVDNPLRDLPSCVLLASKLALEYDVYLVPTAQAATDIFRIAPSVTILNYLRVSNLSLVKKMVDSGLSFSVLDTEGGFFMKVPGSLENTYTKTIISDQNIRSKVGQFFIWGKVLWETLKNRNVYPNSELLCLGTPRMDFYTKPLEAYYDLDQTGRSLILINTSFAGNNPKFSNRAKEMQMLVKKFSYSREFIDKFFADLDTAMNAYIDLTKFLAKTFPSHEILVRPHPFENDQIYRDAFKEFSNVSVHCEGAVGDWLIKSKVLIHYECSTAIEAAFLQVPNFSIAKYRELRPMEHINLVTDYRENFEEIAQAIKDVFSGSYRFPENFENSLKKIEEDIFFKVDGLAHQRIAESISRWMKSRSLKLDLTQKLRIKKYFLIAGVRSVLKFLVKGKVVPVAKRINSAEINSICKRISRATHQDIMAKPLALSSSFKIE